jgi:hypothetical protein
MKFVLIQKILFFERAFSHNLSWYRKFLFDLETFRSKQNSVLIGFLYEIADTCFSVCQSFLCDIKIYVFEKLNFRLFVEYFVIIFISLPYYIFDSSTKKWNYADFYKKFWLIFMIPAIFAYWYCLKKILILYYLMSQHFIDISGKLFMWCKAIYFILWMYGGV